MWIANNIDMWGITIEGSAFLNCSSIERLSIPNLYYLGTKAFGDCTSLTRIDAINLMDWDVEPFGGCANLRNVSIGARIETDTSYYNFIPIPYNELLKNTYFTNSNCYLDQCAIYVTNIPTQPAGYFNAWFGYVSGDGSGINSVMYNRD
jgi:hypothetical protein